MTKSALRPHEETQYSRITPYIYIGTNLCCTDHSRFLKKLDVSVDIDLEYEHGEVMETPAMEMTLYLPTRDHHAPALDKLIVGTAMIAVAVKSKKQVFVHCKNGHGRAPTLAAAYFMAQGMSLDSAVEFIKARRPVIHLNGEQIAALKKFERYLHSHRTYW